MNKKVVAARLRRLAARLRSGKDKQITGTLHMKDGEFCVMGVACDQYMEETKIGSWQDGAFQYSKWAADMVVGTAPSTVLKYYGLNIDDQDTFIDMNDALAVADEDNPGMTFPEFASVFERKADKLDPPREPPEGDSLLAEIKERKERKKEHVL